MPRKLLSRSEVLRRMHLGDLPYMRCGYSSTAAFDDGSLTSMRVMKMLVLEDLVEAPRSVHFPYRLKETDRG